MLWSLVSALLALTALAAIGSWFSPRARRAERLNLAAALIDCALVLILLVRTPARGIEALHGYLFLDPLGLWVMLCTALVYLLASLHAIGYMRGMPGEAARLNRFYGLFAAFALTLFWAPLQNNPGLFWIAMELTTIVSAFLVAFQRAPETIEAAWKYVIIASAGLSLALLGTLLFYWAGTFRAGASYEMTWARFASLAPSANPTLILTAFLLVLAGYGTKVGLAPMHTWLPDAHSEAPAPVSALLSGVLLAVVLCTLVRIANVTALATGAAFPDHLLLGAGVLSVAVAAPFMVVQTDLKRLLAYSSIEQVGLMAVGFGLHVPLAVDAAVLQVVVHALTKSGLFFAAGRAVHEVGSQRLARLRGLGRRAPLLGAAIMIGVLTLGGLPPFGMFFTELAIVQGALAVDIAVGLLLLVLLVGIFGGLAYHTGNAVFGRAGGERAARPAASAAAIVAGPIALSMLAGFLTPGVFARGISAAAALLLGGHAL